MSTISAKKASHMVNETNASTFTSEQEQQIRDLLAAFPFRIVYAATSPTGEWFVSAVLNMRIPNKLAREGWAVQIVKSNR